VPQTARFIAIFNAFNTVPSLSETLIISDGIKEMLIQFVYFHYVRNSALQNTITGVVKASNENSIASIENNVIEVYNKGVSNYTNIQQYIESDSVTYPELVDSSVDYLCYASGI
jgi:hypothetical protein